MSVGNQGGFAGLASPNKSPSPPMWNLINQWIFCQMLEYQSLLQKT